jgi:two-component system chemotaxis response regulator CheB
MDFAVRKSKRESSPLPGVRRVIALGASAGGLHPLLEVLAVLPKTLPCVILVATHLRDDAKSMMPELIRRICPMEVVPAEPGAMQRSTVYVSRPGWHFTVKGRNIQLLDTPPVRFLRPNIDLLFESVAQTFSNRAVGVILSGMGHDGAEGLKAIKLAGGTTLVEDPGSAEFPEMPRAALRTDSIDWVLSSDKIGEVLIKLCTEPSSPRNA